MGQNFNAAGFANVESMVSAMCDGEDEQLNAFASFLRNNRLDVSLRAHDWPSFARGYNGPNYAINQYDSRLAGEYQKYTAGVLPDVTVRAAQLYLTFRGFSPGPIDGVAGTRTLSALHDFQTQAGSTVSDMITDDLVSTLQL
jgi:hypothetical protein